MKVTRIAGALTVVAAVAVPASAAAHPSVYTDATARVLSDPNNPNSLVNQTRHVVTNHGFTYVLRETNGLGAPKGVITFSRLPGAYRATIPFSDWQTEGGTGAQPHATCQVAALETEAAIKAWQDEDPFYNYVPFQKGSAGLEDDPARWIPVVKDITGVDLATLADPATACTNLGGTYTRADQIQTTTAQLNSGFLEHETAPLTAEIAGLKTAVSDADKAKAALQALLDAAKAEIAKLTTAAAPMKAVLPTAHISGKRLAKRGTTVTVTGPAGKAVAVELTIGESRARKLGLTSSTLARAKATLAADGTAKVALKPGKTAGKRVARLERSLSITVTALAGDRIASTTATLTR
jgi:Tfp pilus assembly protein PilN